MHKKLSAAIDAKLASLDDNFMSLIEDTVSCFIAENDSELLDLHTKTELPERWVVLNKKNLCVFEEKSKKGILSLNSSKVRVTFRCELRTPLHLHHRHCPAIGDNHSLTTANPQERALSSSFVKSKHTFSRRLSSAALSHYCNISDLIRP